MRAVVILAAVAALASCGTFVAFRVPPGEVHRERHARSENIRSIFPIRNNTTIHLTAARYVGDLEIDANAVTLVGEGIGRTVISGRLIIRGNAFAARNLTVDGEVIIYGNAADLSRAQVRGRIRNHGHGNRL